MSPSARLRYGPNRPGDAMTSRPSESAPSERGSESSCNASSSVTVSGVWLANSDERFGFFFVPSSCSPSCTYGPKRPVSTNTGRSVSGSVPSAFGPAACLAISSSASSIVSSSGAMSGGSDAVSDSSRCTYGP